MEIQTEQLILRPFTSLDKDILVTFRMYQQLNWDNKKNRVFKKYWNMYAEHFIEDI
ncbi:hypothetical protein [Oceanobacillus oncorhynchi]|uniref:hypothetical protein n=1 Tax=Oceanobacillus oncorhynchi TaxID=545501 RepID=UPI0034D5CA00